MVILIDSREQKPLTFHFPFVEYVRCEKLDVGDYGCLFKDGTECSTYFERKSMSDLFGTMTWGYERFRKEILRAKESNKNIIILIESNILSIFKGTKHSKVDGISIFRKLMTLYIKYGLHFHCCNSREEMELYIYHYYESIGKKNIIDLKDKNKHDRNTKRSLRQQTTDTETIYSH